MEFDLSSHGLNGYISPNLVLLGPLAADVMLATLGHMLWCDTAVAIRGILAVRAVLVVRMAAQILHNNNDTQ